MKRVTLRTPSGEEVTFIGERLNHLSNVISAATTRTMVRKGCEAYLAYVIDTKKEEPSLLDTPIVCDYPNVFPKELPGLPPQREIEFSIDVVSSATPLSITPYRMALVVKRIEASVARIVRERVYSSEYITMGSTSALY